MKKFFQYLRKKRFRLIDSHIGIAGAHLFLKVLAVYGTTTCYIVQIGTMKWFRLSWEYHYHTAYYPRHTFELSIFRKKLIDTGSEAKLLTSESCKKIMAKTDAIEEAGKERIRKLEAEVEKLRGASNETEYPVPCAECGCHVWISTTITYNGMTYCEDCASAEPDQGERNER